MVSLRLGRCLNAPLGKNGATEAVANGHICNGAHGYRFQMPSELLMRDMKCCLLRP